MTNLYINRNSVQFEKTQTADKTIRNTSKNNKNKFFDIFFWSDVVFDKTF